MIKLRVDLVGIDLLIVAAAISIVFYFTQKWNGWYRLFACVSVAATVAYLSGNISASIM